jgi:Fe2+ transport system protein FeoA
MLKNDMVQNRGLSQDKEGSLNLSDLKERDTAVITRLTGGRGLLSRMAGLGLYQGRRIQVVSIAPFSGPILIEDLLSGGRVMISRKIASRVEVMFEES